jgi:hypothetical protein
MIPQLTSTTSAGSSFDTIALSEMKMNDEVIAFDSGRAVKILLKNSKMVKEAIWQLPFDPVLDGTGSTCHIYCRLGPLYFFLYPVLLLNKNARRRDLRFFKMALKRKPLMRNSLFYFLVIAADKRIIHDRFL